MVLIHPPDLGSCLLSDQGHRGTTYRTELFVGKGYACDRMFKLNIENNISSASSVYMLSFVNFWHACLCHISSRYVGIMSNIGLIPKLTKDFEKCEHVFKLKLLNSLIKMLKEIPNC